MQQPGGAPLQVGVTVLLACVGRQGVMAAGRTWPLAQQQLGGTRLQVVWRLAQPPLAACCSMP
jgi:hypothetical protein